MSAAPSGRGRSALALGAAALGVAALAAWLLGPCATAPPPPAPPVAQAPAPAPAPPPAPAPAAAELKVIEVRGTVERGAPGAAWRPLARGDTLHADEQIRTGPKAGADLAAGERAQLTRGERTQIAVREVSARIHRLGLAQGLVNADYRGDGPTLRIEGSGAHAPVIEARAARVHVSASGLAFAVATETGGVSLTSGGASVSLGANEATRARTGEAPDQPRAIPTSVLLKVAEAGRASGRGCLDTTGEADPTATVTVDGEEVPVGPVGRFPLRVPQPGRGPVLVRAVLPDGRVNERRVPCRVDPGARIEDLRVRWKNAGR